MLAHLERGEQPVFVGGRREHFESALGGRKEGLSSARRTSPEVHSILQIGACALARQTPSRMRSFVDGRVLELPIHSQWLFRQLYVGTLCVDSTDPF